jgi:hypothetical protein
VVSKKGKKKKSKSKKNTRTLAITKLAHRKSSMEQIERDVSV